MQEFTFMSEHANSQYILANFAKAYLLKTYMYKMPCWHIKNNSTASRGEPENACR